GNRQDQERPFDRPDTLVGRGDRRVDDAMGMAMRTSSVIMVVAAMGVTMILSAKAEPIEKLHCHRLAHRYFDRILNSRSACSAGMPPCSTASAMQCSM